MKLPYGYVLNDDEIVIHEERAILLATGLGKIAAGLERQGISSLTGKPR